MLANLVRRSLLLPLRRSPKLPYFPKFETQFKIGTLSRCPILFPQSKALFSIGSEITSYKGRAAEVKQALEDYIKRSKVNALNPSESFLKFEEIIRNYSKSCEYENLLSSNEYSYPGGIGGYFIALAAPSLTGKTQMAFNIRSRRPLYFTADVTQNINKNFTNLSKELLNAVVEDQNHALKYLESKGYVFASDQIKTISLDLIFHQLFDFKFKSLGLLAHLVADGEKHFDGLKVEDDWMRFYTRNEDYKHEYKYESLSLNELESRKDIQEPLLSKYFVFLDEFRADGNEMVPSGEKLIQGLVLLRNLCRFLQFPCVLASTNSNVANLIGYSLRTGSRSERPIVWCLVKPKYHNLPLKEIESEFNDSIDFQAIQVKKEEKDRIDNVIQFIKDQCAKSRAGVTYLAIEALSKTIKGHDFVDSDTFFIRFMEQLIDSVINRKSNAFFTNEGVEANIRLLSGAHFDPKYVPHSAPKSNDAAMIDNHFAYLKTPIENPKVKDHFLLFRYKSSPRGSRLCRTPTMSDTYKVQCYFDEGEELLKMVCLMVDICGSTRAVFNSFDERGDINDIKNPFANSTPGSSLENITFSSIIDSSHYSDSEQSVNFRGVEFENFLRNLLRNLSNADTERLKQAVTIVHDPKLEIFMKSLKVPCLYIANRDWNPELRKIFDPKESSFRLGQYSKTPNSSEIDAVFDLIDGRDGADDINSLSIVECKNWDRKLPVSEYAEVLEKALKYTKLKHIKSLLTSNYSNLSEGIRESFNEVLSYTAKQQKDNKAKMMEVFNGDLLKNICPTLHLLFCNSCADIPSNFLETVEHSKGLKINILRLVKKAEDYYELENFKDEIHSDPEMTAVIIELDTIDRKIKKKIKKHVTKQ